MLYGLSARFTCDSNDIKTHIEVYAMIANIGIGSLHNLVYLIICNSIYGIAITIVLARLHLYYCQRIILLRHNIKFLMSNPPIAVTDSIPTRHKISYRTIFTDSTKFVMLRHEINELFVCKNSASQAKKQIKAEKRI